MTAPFRLNTLFFTALWAWLRAHPKATFEDFQIAIDRTQRLLARMETPR